MVNNQDKSKIKTQKEENKQRIKKLLEQLIPKYGIGGTARKISKEIIPISYSTIRDWARELGVEYAPRDKSRLLYSEKKSRELINKLNELSKKDE